MRKENGRLGPADSEEKADILGKKFICKSCQIEFFKRGVEFGETILCPKCNGAVEEAV